MAVPLIPGRLHHRLGSVGLLASPIASVSRAAAAEEVEGVLQWQIVTDDL